MKLHSYKDTKYILYPYNYAISLTFHILNNTPFEYFYIYSLKN